MRLTASVLMACAVLGPGSPGLAGDYAPRVGQPHPEIFLPTIDGGRPVALSEFRGKKVLLIQFASW